MIETLFKATVLLVLVAIIAYALRRSSAAWRHMVWALGLCGIAAIPALTALVPFRLAVLPASTPAAASLRNEAPAARDKLQSRTEPAVERSTNSPVAVSPIVDAPTEQPFDGRRLLVALWILGAVGLITRFVVGLGMVQRVARRARDVTDPDWVALRDRAARAFNITQPVALRRSDDVAMPFACGLLKPTIILPASADEWTVDRREAVLMHEFAHISRGDLAMNLGSHLVRALYWFHPLAWLAAYRLRVEGERACDDAVLRAGARPSDYAEHLLSIVRSVGSTVPNVALAMARRSDFEGRLLAILEPGVSRATLSRWRAAALATLFFGAVLPLSAMAPSAAAPGSSSEQLRVSTESATAPVSAIATRASASLQQQPTTVAAERSQTQGGGAVGALMDALTDANAAVRLAAVGSLGSLGDPRAIAALTKALKEDTDARVREAAAHALGEIDDVRAVPALIEALARERAPNVREKIVHALGEIDDPSAVSGIAGATKDASVAVRRAVAWALGELHDPSAVPALISMAGDDDVEVRRYVADALGELETSSAIEPLITLAKDSDAEVRSNAISSLSDLDDRRALPVYITALKDSNAEVRSHAASALGDLELKTAPPALIAALTDADAEVRQQVAQSLGDIGDEAAVPGLTRLTADTNKDVRHSAAEALAEIGGVEAIQTLMGLLKDQDPEIRRIAAEALGKRRD
jgi:HEAT repeat protein/beta-lactamase regulating signal transducer with metallopeptidase domain